MSALVVKVLTSQVFNRALATLDLNHKSTYNSAIAGCSAGFTSSLLSILLNAPISLEGRGEAIYKLKKDATTNVIKFLKAMSGYAIFYSLWYAFKSPLKLLHPSRKLYFLRNVLVSILCSVAYRLCTKPFNYVLEKSNEEIGLVDNFDNWRFVGEVWITSRSAILSLAVMDFLKT